ncbi:hypothetical protein DPMN_121500 [Dreissena polymorpha]|uniref:Uncharacterized protein n=1 Tax=Dreissena polymorpha TaxID=45954 RepID=A0A9D4JPK5_DREPO|nr:hypothetical protein DPMN_121500 [Dreissena polymorpha]
MFRDSVTLTLLRLLTSSTASRSFPRQLKVTSRVHHSPSVFKTVQRQARLFSTYMYIYCQDVLEIFSRTTRSMRSCKGMTRTSVVRGRQAD